VYKGWEVETSGNPYTHAILRGAVSQHGRNFPNYHFEDIIHLRKRYLDSGLVNPAIIVDVSHANSNKDFREQPRVSFEVLNSRRYAQEIRDIVKGLMIESYLVEGTQGASEGVYGKSITDACLGWEDSVRLVRTIAEMV
jgi:3-deoxy-7-phosphoheptulonate synthase